MLTMRPNCERCDRDLPADATDAVICSFECTFCRACNDEFLHATCPNCQGVLTTRPTRVGASLAEHPASTQRIVAESGGACDVSVGAAAD